LSSKAAEFDPFEGEYQVDPADSLRWSRDEEPVFFSPKLRYWVVTRYDDVKAIFRNNILFSPSIALEKITPAPPEAQEILKRYGYAMDRTMVNEDEPAHMERRRLLMDSFSPEALSKHETSIRQLTQRYVDRFIDKGEVDLVAEMLWEIPLTVALHFLGVRDDDIDELRQFCVAHTINTWGRPSLQEQLHVADSVGRFWRAANGVLNRMMENPSGDGWMYFSIRQHLKHPDVVPLSYLRSMMMAILVAAHETTSKATTNAMRLLLSDRAAWNQLNVDPSLIPMAVEECLRRAGSIVSWRRIATAPARVGDVEIPEGAKLLLVMASANHDERKFESPAVLDLHRENTADHLSFGYGAHQCMGKNIARMEMRIFLEELTRRLPHMELVPDQEFKYLPNTSFRGPESLRVRWDPGRNPERRDGAIPKSRQSFKIGPPARADIARPVRVVGLNAEADRILRIVLEAPDGRDLPAWDPGAHIHVLLGEYDRRYSLCGDPENRKHYELRILKEPAGKGGSRHIHESLRLGDMLRIRGPKNHFRLDESESRYLLIAGGIGITPIVAMAHRLKQLGKRYDIHYAGRSVSSMALLERLRHDHGENLQLYPAFEGARLDLRALVERTTADRVYACGPDRLLTELVSLSSDWPENVLHLEHFSAAQAIADHSRDRSFEIELRDSQITLQVPSDKTALDVLEAAGIDVACDCREGLCGSCEVQVLEGEVEHRDRVLSQSERARNTQMITCCSRARGCKIVLAL
jgi:cytochrome P450/ferredoxin-NADP reductase